MIEYQLLVVVGGGSVGKGVGTTGFKSAIPNSTLVSDNPIASGLSSSDSSVSMIWLLLSSLPVIIPSPSVSVQ